MLSTSVLRLISIPMDMKNIAMNRFFMGSMSWLISLLFLQEATIIPIRNAPIAIESPTNVDKRAIPNAIPMENTTRTSEDTLSETQFMMRGTMRSPMTMLAIMNTRMLMIITMSPLVFSDVPASMGVRMDSMMTWPMSSMMVIRTSISMCSLSSFPWDLRTAMTTAVLEPEMIAPSVMHWSVLKPNRVPARNPPNTISGSCMAATSMAKRPCFLIFFRLISNPMQNISMTNPMSDNISTTLCPSSFNVQKLATIIPATR